MELKIYRSGMVCALHVCESVCVGKDAVAVCAPVCMHFCEYSFVHLHQGVSETNTHTHTHTDREAEVSNPRGDNMPR